MSKEWQGTRPGGTRHLDQWHEPPEYAQGWTHLVEAIHPWDELRGFSEPGLAGKGCVDLPVGPGWAVHVYILTARLPITSMTFPSALHFATLVVDDGTLVVAVAGIQPWDAGARVLETSRRRTESDGPRNLAPPTRTIDPYSPSVRLTLHGTHVDGTRIVIDSAGDPQSS